MRSVCSSTIHSVLMARLSSEVKATSNSKPSRCSSSAALRASATPFAVRSTSVQPVKRFSWFQTDSPCRSRTIFFMATQSENAPSGDDIGVALGLIGHERNEPVADDPDLRQDLLSLGSLLPHRNGTLFESVDAWRAAQLLDAGRNLCGQGAILRLDLVRIRLHELRRGPAECQDEMRRDPLLDK